MVLEIACRKFLCYRKRLDPDPNTWIAFVSLCWDLVYFEFTASDKIGKNQKTFSAMVDVKYICFDVSFLSTIVDLCQ